MTMRPLQNFQAGHSLGTAAAHACLGLPEATKCQDAFVFASKLIDPWAMPASDSNSNHRGPPVRSQHSGTSAVTARGAGPTCPF